MKKFINMIRESIWIYPTIYSIVALSLSIGITIIDKAYANEMSNYLNNLFYTTLPLAQTVLSIVAAAFITIATFTFSTTMIVLTMYSSQFTPRVVENFLNNKTTMKSFGVFLSGFIYAITSLLFLRTNQDGNFAIAASVGVIYIIIGLIYFLIFIQSVSDRIQVSNLILRLYEEALEKIKQYCKVVEELDIVSEDKMYKIIDNKKSLNVTSLSDGYIQEIDYHRSQKIAGNHHCIICFRKVVGQFISIETRILTIYYDEHKEFDESMQNEIQQCILIGNKKTQVQDFSFTIQKIVEIAVKSLSSGINDPNTAIHCLKIIGILLRDLADIKKGYVIMKDKNEFGFIIYEAFDFKVLLYDAYSQIMFYGQADASLLIEGFKSLSFIKAKASKDNIELIDEYAKHLYEKRTNLNYSKLEYDKVENEYKALMQS